MHATSLFVAIPVAIVLVASASPSSASPTMVNNDKHHAPAFNRTKSTTATRNATSTASRHTRAKHVIEPRSLDALSTVLDVYLGKLSSDHEGVLSASNAFTHTAKKARTQSAQDPSYPQDCAAGLTSFRDSLDPLQSLFAQLGKDNGLANYDKSNEYETLLKQIVNACKYTFNDVNDLIYAIPLLGPILAPIMYEIKCILDNLLDATENITDGVLNSCGPLFQPLINSATHTVCNSIQPPVAGLCLQL